MIGISHYEGLVTKSFDFPEYVRKMGGLGCNFVRVFVDLPFWVGNNMDPDNFLFLYKYDKVKKKYNPNQFNLEFITRLNETGKALKQNNMIITLCLGVDPSYFDQSTHKSYTKQLKYVNGHDLFHRGDDPAFPGRWESYLKFISDLSKVTADAPNPLVFRIWETGNELETWGSLLDECLGIQKAVKSERVNAVFQLNPPRDELAGGYDWPKRLLKGVAGFRAAKLAFHGFFKASEMMAFSKELKENDMPINTIVMETDGATPNGVYTKQSHSGHYQFRLDWYKNPNSVQGTIEEHRKMIATAKSEGFDLNIQDPIKWSLEIEREANRKFWEEMGKEIKK